MALEANADTFVSLFTILILLASLASAIDVDQFLLRIKKPKGIIIGLLCQYGILPVTAFVVSVVFDLEPSIGIAMVIVGTCPGGAMSNFWCFVFNSDLPLSIAMTTCSSTLSFAFIAMNGAIYIPILSKGTNLNIDWAALALSVAAVLCGILIGIFIAYKQNKKVIKVMGIVGLITMLSILIWALVNVGGSDAPLVESDPLVFVGIACMNIVSLGTSFGFSLCAKLKRQSAVSVAIESSNQNTTLAIAIILLSLESGYERDLALNVPVIYMLMNGVFVIAFGVTLRRTGWLKMDESDKTMTLGRLIKEWRQNRNRKGSVGNESVVDPTEKEELSEERKKRKEVELEQQVVVA